MAIKKLEFYEGAALRLLACAGGIAGIRYEPPFFLLNEDLLVRVKYSTKSRSPWAFTFTGDEQAVLQEKASEFRIVIGLVCGGDGVVTLSYEDYFTIAEPRETAVHIASYRHHREHYEVSGPDGILLRKVSPSSWLKILESRGGNEAS